MMTTPPTTRKSYADAREVAGMVRTVMHAPARTRVSVMTERATAWNAETLAMTMKVPVMAPTRNAPVPREVRTALKRNQGNDIRPTNQGFPHIFQWAAGNGDPFFIV
jgi:hypothetical protein